MNLYINSNKRNYNYSNCKFNNLNWLWRRRVAVLNKVIVIATVITYTILSNNVIMFLFFTICHCYCRYTNLHLTLFSYLIHYFVGQNYNCKFSTLPFGGGAFWGFNQYCICNYYGGVCLLVIVLPLLLEIQKGVSEIFLVFHAYGANLYCIWDSYGSLCFYLLLLLMCL